KMIGYSEVIGGHVDSISPAISGSNAQPNNQGGATVNPIFTLGRLAQRIPVRVHIDQIPDGMILAAGMSAPAQIDDRSAFPVGSAKRARQSALASASHSLMLPDLTRVEPD